MEQLKVIGIEEGVLVVATEAGERYALAVDESLRAPLRRAERDAEPRSSRPSPREIQAHIRSGLSAAEVAELLGARLEDVQRYERPVLAEREHIVDQALSVPVLMAGDLDPGTQPTFGTAVRAKLADAGAVGERWTSWREEATWIVKLEFTANAVDHDARWSFDPRRSTLAPQNADATQLSRQGSLPEGLIPRLRALDASPLKDSSRFDSGAFGARHPDASAPSLPAASAHAGATPAEPPTESRAVATAAVQQAAIKRAPDTTVTTAETADLLEALRRRRGLREPMPGDAASEQGSAPRAHAPVALFDALEPGYDEAEDVQDDEIVLDDTTVSDAARRKGRAAMPSWDEIVFGARTEDG